MPVKILNPKDEVEHSHGKAAQISRIVWFVVGFLEGVLALRLVLNALEAGETAGFPQMILMLTRPFATPFLGIFPNAGTDGFEPASVVAMGFYLLVGVALIKIVRILYGETRQTDLG